MIEDDAYRLIHVVQGEFVVARERDVVLTTVLGSCVATCLYDRNAGLGGMNHFLLPDAGGGASKSNSFGVNAMELLINSLLKRGADRANFEAKIFGGASMIAGMGNIGKKNVEFATSFLDAEGIPIVSSSVGGDRARRVQFWPTDGRARQKQLPLAETISVRAREPLAKPVPQPVDAGEVELF